MYGQVSIHVSIFAMMSFHSSLKSISLEGKERVKTWAYHYMRGGTSRRVVDPLVTFVFTDCNIRHYYGL